MYADIIIIFIKLNFFTEYYFDKFDGFKKNGDMFEEYDRTDSP